jgi:hypothetical protein
MRVPRTAAWWRRSGWLAVTLGVAGALAGALVGAGPAAAAGTASLTLRPDRGRPTAPFLVQYSFSPDTNVCPATVAVTWDDRPLGTARVTRAGQRFSSLCVASLNGTPLPDDLAVGRHTIGVPAVAGHPARTASYTVLPGPTPTLTPGFSADPSQGVGDPAAGVTTMQASAAPLANAAPAPSVAAASTPSGGGGGFMSLILLFGGLLVVGGVIIFGLLIYWTRRGEGGGVEADPATPDARPLPGTAGTTVYGASRLPAAGFDDVPASQTRTAVYGAPAADTATRTYPPQDPYSAENPYSARDPYSSRDPYGAQEPYPARDSYSAPEPRGGRDPYPAQDPYGAKDPQQTAYDPYAFDHGDRPGPGSHHR